MGEAPEFDAGSVVEAMAPLVKLELDEASRAHAIEHLTIAQRLAARLLETPFADDDEPAAVFRP